MKKSRDLQSLVYLILYPCLLAHQIKYGFHGLAYAASLLLAVGVSVIHHNHLHHALWTNSVLNLLTRVYLTFIQGVPSQWIIHAHIDNHHRFTQGPLDFTRTYRFGGDHNCLLGYLIHPFQVVAVLISLFSRKLTAAHRMVGWVECGFILAIHATMMRLIGFKLYILFIFIPWGMGLHWFLGANYLQHAHCEDQTASRSSRNFLGLVNLIWFNIGYHTAHHLMPSLHWSELPRLHRRFQNKIEPTLLQHSLIGYVFKTYLASSITDRFRSRSLRS